MIPNDPNIRTKPGYTENYYKIRENLGSILSKILANSKICAVDSGLMDSGFTNVTLWIKDTRGKKYFVKIGVEDNLIAEIFWYKKVHSRGLAVPKIIMLDCSKKVVPYIYQVREFVDGIHANNNVSLKLQYNGAYLAGQELRKIHGISVKGFGTINSDGKWTKANWSSTLKEFLDPYAQDKCATKIFTKQEIDKVYEHTIYNKDLEIKKPRLIHGDIQDDNFVYNPEQNKITFIDPGSMIGGDPMFDLACSSMPWSRKAFFEGLQEGYELNHPLTDYEQYRFKKLQLAYFLFASIELYRKQFDYPQFVRLTKELILKA